MDMMSTRRPRARLSAPSTAPSTCWTLHATTAWGARKRASAPVEAGARPRDPCVGERDAGGGRVGRARRSGLRNVRSRGGPSLNAALSSGLLRRRHRSGVARRASGRPVALRAHRARRARPDVPDAAADDRAGGACSEGVRQPAHPGRRLALSFSRHPSRRRRGSTAGSFPPALNAQTRAEVEWLGAGAGDRVEIAGDLDRLQSLKAS